MSLFWEPSNHQSLCIGCNSYKAALLEGGFGNEGVGGSNLPGGAAADRVPGPNTFPQNSKFFGT